MYSHKMLIRTVRTFGTITRRSTYRKRYEMAILSKNNTHFRLLLFAAIGVMVARRRKQFFKKKQLRRFWRRGILKDRKLHSENYHMYQAMRESDREWHYRYVRMSKERFDHLLGLLHEKITKRDTYMREGISAEERLVITLRYLSAGMSQQTLCDNFRVGRTTVSNIIKEICVAIYELSIN